MRRAIPSLGGKRTVHYVGGLGVRAGHWAHAEPAPHATPKLALLTSDRNQAGRPFMIEMPPADGLSAGSMKSRRVRAGYFTPRRPDTSAIDREYL
jgi:hypothetical protein